jgi:hypothetical protein
MDGRIAIDKEIEVWKSILGYEGKYEVSNRGRVRSLPRLVKTYQGHRKLSARILKPYLMKTGYLEVKLSSPSRYALIHSLVLSAFVSPREPKKVARHLNDIRTDNRLENLAWGTPSENAFDARRNGGLLCGERHPFSKLTWEKVEQIRASHLTHTELARQFGTSRRNVGLIKKFQSWASR